MLKSGVGEYFLQLNALLRPLIQRRWAVMVAQLNRLEESQLEMFLFGADRTRTAKIRVGLWEIQRRRCFYCDARIAEPVRGQVDHFVPCLATRTTLWTISWSPTITATDSRAAHWPRLTT
jgi:hypothetical protein